MTAKVPEPPGDDQDERREVLIPANLTVGQLAQLLEASPIEVIKGLMRSGVLANINQVIDYHSAATLATELGFAPKKEAVPPREATYRRLQAEEGPGAQPRPPVVTIMGHVDHGKTSLLDAIRESNIIATEAGEITQHIGAYQAEVNGQKITFLDTPGHEAFTAMRARGAQVTDIAILVVAADDGVMPQTVEAINHARAAQVPIVVAINKIDKAEANVDRVKQQLADHGVLIEEWGGEVVCVPISARRREGISALLENLLLVAEIQELSANPNRKALAAVVEARLDSTRGSVATVLVQAGTIKVGDTFTVGDTWGRVKALFDDRGKRVHKAGPATPVEILGVNGVPRAGDLLRVVGTEKEARALVRQRQEREQVLTGSRALKLDDVFSQIQSGQVKELNLILKTDVQGSIDPLRTSLERLGTSEVQVRIIHSATGSITESDVMLAIASGGIVVGFNTRPEHGAKRLADAEGVDVRCYEVIYDMVNDIEKALAGLLGPIYEEVVEGHAEVRAVFPVRQGKVAGVYVTDGKAARGARVRIVRGGQSLHEGGISSLRHFKENVREMAAGFECGVGIEGFSDFQVGDILEFYRQQERPRI